MRAIMKKEFEDAGSIKSLAGTDFFNRSFNSLLVVLRYTFLVVFLVLLASHEAANPKFGKSSVEFYRDEFKMGIVQELDNDYSTRYSVDETRLVNNFYSSRGYFPAWTVNFEPNTGFNELIKLIASSYHYGLLPSNYYINELTAFSDSITGEVSDEDKLDIRIRLEKTATRAAIRLIKHLAVGIRENDTTTAYTNYLLSIPGYLSEKLDNDQLRAGILEVQPENAQYIRLQRALSCYLYRALDDTVNYTTTELETNISLIAKRLVKQGYLAEDLVNDTLAIQSAVRNFQKSHYIAVSGDVNEETLELLKVGTKEKFYRIALNLDRIRKDEIKNENSILVNIPEYRLRYYNSKGQETEFDVMVGKTSSPTPLITSKLERIVTNPHWTVPKRIARYEILPRIKKDSLYLSKHGFRVIDNSNEEIDASTIDWENIEASEFNYWIRQTKMNNALGVVKFLFPNPYSVYLHDTQSKRLFKKQIRAYSHGCIRVQHPEELAQMLVSEYGETEEDIKSLIRNKKRKDIRMKDTVSVYIRYYSCTADSLGNITYHPDIYSMDDSAIQELFGNSSWN